MKKPNSRRHLDAAIERLVGRGRPYVEARTVMANAIVGQMLPNGVVKGGSALKIRFGDVATRFTSDLDTAREGGVSEYIKELNDSLREGWQGFEGAAVAKRPVQVRNVPDAYVMQPYSVKLSYLGKSWVTVPLEIGHNEIGDAEIADMIVPKDASELLSELGFPLIDPIPVMRLSHQIAQKLHALTERGSRRAHDLVDLQLILSHGVIDLVEVRNICQRLFAYRNRQPWPPSIRKGEGWDTRYASASAGLDVIADVDGAVEWANGLVHRIDAAPSS